MRVEYKSTFDDNVKRKLPKVLSSFANSYGGILIIGINAPAGAPQEPFDGIVFPEKERSRLGPVRTPKPSSQCNQHNQEREENNSYAGPALGISFGGHSEGKNAIVVPQKGTKVMGGRPRTPRQLPAVQPTVQPAGHLCPFDQFLAEGILRKVLAQPERTLITDLSGQGSHFRLAFTVSARSCPA
jgi:hypothetical protein